MKNKRAGFTLAEVLITLGIIGVVATLTMPTLIQKQNEKAMVVALKKFYSTTQQAWNLYQTENPGGYDPEEFIKKFKTVKICKQTPVSCADKEYRYLNNNTTTAFGIDDVYGAANYAVLSDGMIIRYDAETASSLSSNCTAIAFDDPIGCGAFTVDINGNKGPNVFGKDTFNFELTPKRVIPYGLPEHESNTFAFSKRCSSQKSTSFSCAAWVLYNENMDYLHCPDELSWNGKHKCH